MACNCVDKMNEKLAQHNSELVLGFGFVMKDGSSFEYPALRTRKIKPRSREEMGAIPTFCPFCGTKYRASEPS